MTTQPMTEAELVAKSACIARTAAFIALTEAENEMLERRIASNKEAISRARAHMHAHAEEMGIVLTD